MLQFTARLGLAIIVVAWSSAVAHATSKTWIAAGGGNFTGPGNWNPSGLPGAADKATFSAAGTYTVTFNNSPNPLPNPVLNQDLFVSAGNVTFTSGTGGPFTYQLTGGGGSDANITGGTLTLGNGINPLNLTVDDDLVVSGGATLNVNSGSVVNTLDLVLAQGVSGAGHIVVDGTGTALNVSDSTTQSLGLNGNTATLTFSNASTGSNTGPLDVGGSSNGTVNVQSGAHPNFGTLSVGSGTGTGTVNINDSGSTLVQSGAAALTVGAASGGTGTMNIGTATTGGTLTTGTGLFTINKTGTVNIGSTTTTGTINANGNVTIDGGVLQVLNPDSSFFVLAPSKTLTVQNGGLALLSSIISNVGYTTAANAIYNATGTGSKLEATVFTIGNGSQVNISSGGELSVGAVVVDGGVLQVVDPSHTGSLVAPIFLVQNGGRATLDLGGRILHTDIFGPGGPAEAVTGTNSKLELVDGSGLAVSGIPQLRVDLGGSLIVAGGITISVGSEIIIDSGGTVTANALSVSPGSLEFNNGTLGITGAAGLSLDPTTSFFGTNFSLGPNRTLNITNTTTIPVGSSLTVDGGTFNTGNLVINGAFNYLRGALGITGPAGLTVGAGGVLGSTLVLNANQALHITNTLTVNAGAYLDVAGGFSAGNLVNNGDLVVVNSAVDGPVVNNHAVTVVGNVNFNGLVSGPGNFFGPGTAHFNGGMSPGASPATVSFEGSVALGTGNTLTMELGGTNPGTQYDQLHVTGQLSMGGALQVMLINPGTFTPRRGNKFDILDWGSLSGVFSSLQLPALASPLRWNVGQLYADGTLSVIDSNHLPGDFNRDNQVTGADIPVMLQALTNIPGYQLQYSVSDSDLLAIGDFDNSGAFTNADMQGLLYLLSHGGIVLGSPSPAAAVPEPTSISLLLMGAIGGLVITRASQRGTSRRLFGSG